MRKIENILFIIAVVAIIGYLTTMLRDPMDLKSNKADAKKILHQKGYADIEWLPYASGGCSSSEWYSTHFKATQGSNSVEGFVCQLLTGAAVVRTKIQ